MQKQKRVDTHITVLIPSKFVDDNLKIFFKKYKFVKLLINDHFKLF